jgi:hypothetical protein
MDGFGNGVICYEINSYSRIMDEGWRPKTPSFLPSFDAAKAEKGPKRPFFNWNQL